MELISPSLGKFVSINLLQIPRGSTFCCVNVIPFCNDDHVYMEKLVLRRNDV